MCWGGGGVVGEGGGGANKKTEFEITWGIVGRGEILTHF